MSELLIEKYKGFSECEKRLTERASEGWVLWGLTYDHMFKDIFLATYKKGDPERAKFRIHKIVEQKWEKIYASLNKIQEDGWELVSSSWDVASAVVKTWQILVVACKQKF